MNKHYQPLDSKDRKQQVPKIISYVKPEFRHRDRGIHRGRVGL